MSKNNVLLVAGSREIDRHVHEIGDLISTARVTLASVTPLVFHTLLHGGARGVDTIAGDWARRRGFEVKVMPADWDQYGKAAGMIRNKEMVEAADAAIVIWNGRSSGTKSTIDLLVHHMRPHVVCVLP